MLGWLGILCSLILGTNAILGRSGIQARENACPAQEDIAPCECYFTNNNQYVTIDCSSVADDDELARVFQADFPQTNFTRLVIYENENIHKFSNHIFGEITFEFVEVINSGLQWIEARVFIESTDTLKEFDLEYNNIHHFPFETLDQYTVLEKLNLLYNSIEEYPSLNSSSLTHLVMSHNPVSSPAQDQFIHLPNLQEFWCYVCGITDLPENLFESNLNLTKAMFGSNNLTHIAANTFNIKSTALYMIDLYNNDINTFDDEAFSIVSDYLDTDLQYNEIETLDEAVFRNLLDRNATISLNGNVLTCGCEDAWIVLNPQYHDHLILATCENGQWLVDQDPTWYQENC